MAGYDALVIGTGQAGPPLAKRLAGAGMKVADRRARRVRRHLHQHRLHADQDAGRQRLRRAHGAPRGGFRRGDPGRRHGGHAPGEGAQGRHRQRMDGGDRGVVAQDRTNCTVYQGQARFVGPPRSRSAANLLAAERIFINVGGRASVPPIPGLDRVALSHQQLDPRSRRVARASGDRRRQLCRARIRARCSPVSAAR